MKAYITLLSTENYTPGVVALHRSLCAVKAKYPFYCVLSVDVDEKTQWDLEKKGIPCIRLKRAAVAHEVVPKCAGMEHWNYTFDKLLVWELTQFEKLVFLDSDMLVLHNVDELFEREPFSAVVAGASMPGNEDWKDLNSGLMVIEPDESVAKALQDHIVPTMEELHAKGRKAVGDQDVITHYLSNWRDKENLHLEEGFNIFAVYLDYYISSLGYTLSAIPTAQGKSQKLVRIVHFTGKVKPWMERCTIRYFIRELRKWWQTPYYAKAYRKYRRYI